MANQGQRGPMNPYNAQPYPSSSYAEEPSATPPPPPPPPHGFRPGMHPQSNFQRMQEERGYGVSSQQSNHNDTRSQSPPVSRRPVGAAIPQQQPPYREMSPSPPMHPGMPTIHTPNVRLPNHEPGNAYRPSGPYPQDPYSSQRPHNYGPALAGGAAVGMGAGTAIALEDRQTSPTAISPPGNMGSYAHLGGYGQPSLDHIDQGFEGDSPYRHMNSHESYGSEAPLRITASPPPVSTPGYSQAMYNGYSDRSPSPNRQAMPYADSPIPHSRSHNHVNDMAYVDPNAIVDDGDDGFGVHNSKRNSRINLPFNKSKSSVNGAPLAGAGAGVLAARAVGDDGSAGSVPGGDSNGFYAPVSAAGLNDPALEKSVWLKDTKTKGTKWKKILFILLGLLIVLGIAGGAVGGILSTRKSNAANSGSGGQTAAQDDGSGDLNKNSAEIQKLLNNPNLHKVFSGLAYTPINTQYPACLTYPPSQNNVTRDMAMISQLTNVVRLYGTDCNQTEMVLHAINKLQLTDMKVWLGVWLGNNDTTNTRQVAQMWNILGANPASAFKGVIMGNEVLFRKDLTATQLGTYLSQTKSNLTAKGINLPVATSDLGDNWTADLATEVDVVMSNIHPFFGGVAIDQAAAWTWNFWQSHDVSLTTAMSGKKNIISEFGWPSTGGNDCGTSTTVCPDSTSGAVASIPNMNTLMNTWVCQALANGTDYFWFEAFDEPWKIQFDTANQNWEDKWGLMDVNRNLKKGLVIPSCGGQTAPT